MCPVCNKEGGVCKDCKSVYYYRKRRNKPVSNFATDERVCLGCNKTFKALTNQNPKKRYCTLDCFRKIYYEKNKDKLAEYAKNFRYGLVGEQRRCSLCNKSIFGTHLKDYCVECRNSLKYKIINCKQCGEEFKTTRPNKQKFCSADCRNKFQYKKHISSGKSTYYGIRRRCNNVKNEKYHLYGGKGIKCLISLKEFLEIFWRTDHCEICSVLLNDTNRRGKDGRTIDRINNNGHYEKENLRIVCRKCNGLHAVDLL